jgi:organic radical activating enzyme
MIYKDIDYLAHGEEMTKLYNVDTMCTAKFLTSTTYLQTGTTHSCYHPSPHYIPLSEIQSNPSAIHNTKHKKEQRKKMLCGERPEECNYCWNIEDLGESHVSDRIIKSKNETLIIPGAHKFIKEHGWDHNYIPSYMEISFGNECNQKCFYCHPKASSRWQNEMEEFGYIKGAPQLQRLHETIYKEDANPYLNAFWKWWPELSTKIKVLRLTGGEPLIQKSIWRFLDMLEDHNNPDLIFQLNSNLNVKPVLVKKLIEKVNLLLKNNKIKKFNLYTSLESWGERAEYARCGLDLNLWEDNLKYVIKNVQKFKHDTTDWSNPCSTIHIMNTFNVLSVTSYKMFLEKILEWRREFAKDNGAGKIYFDIPHATEPSHVILPILPDSYLKYFDEIEKFMEDNLWKNPEHKAEWFSTNRYHHWFTDEELGQFKRVSAYFKTSLKQQECMPFDRPEYLSPHQIDNARKNFKRFIDALDKRRNTSFLETFPEMKDFYELCVVIEEDPQYSATCEKHMLSDKKVEFHYDDWFFITRPTLSNRLLKYRETNHYSTLVYKNDELVEEIK